MTLIKSISGIRGTIGGKPGDGLTPIDIVKFTSAFVLMLKAKEDKKKLKIVIGRDARLSGFFVNNLVCGTLQSMGADVIDLGLSTTPTVEIAVPYLDADGGIIITASHNPKQWNALKLLNSKGEFISAHEGNELLKTAESDKIQFSKIAEIGTYSQRNDFFDIHINNILALPLVDVEAIKKAKFKVVVDSVNSTGGLVLGKLLKSLNVESIFEINATPDGNFAHDPEPLPDNLNDLSQTVIKKKAHCGFAVDPDVDRLAIVCEDGEMFGEEYTLVAVADYILRHQKGNTVSNLSSTRALRDITEKAGAQYEAAAVGEVNVVEKMKEINAIIGGEGNGGIIYPELHYGRDALVGIALFLSHLAKFGKSCSMLKSTYPKYTISKNKIELSEDIDVDGILRAIKQKYKKQPIISIDGVKIEFDKEWVHLRKSNTEPIIRIYAESENNVTADHLAHKIISDIKEIVTAKRNH